MSRIALRYVELHAPFFIHSEKGGRNLGNKLNVAQHKTMMIEYEPELDQVYVWLDGAYGEGGPTAHRLPFVVPKPQCMHPHLKKPIEIRTVGDTTQRVIPQSAQVSTPYGHVHAGPGQGQTGQEPPQVKAVEPEVVKRGPGRPPKVKDPEPAA